MATEEDIRTGHPVPDGVRALASGVTALAERPLFALDAATTRDTVLAVAVLESKVAALKLAVLAHADRVQVGAETGCTPAGVWAANATRNRKAATAAQVRLAGSLAERWHRVRDALVAGAMNPEQTRVVVTALEDLPEDLEADLVCKAEETMVEYARDFDPNELTILGARILSVIAPEVGESSTTNGLRKQNAKRPRSAG